MDQQKKERLLFLKSLGTLTQPEAMELFNLWEEEKLPQPVAEVVMPPVVEAAPIVPEITEEPKEEVHSVVEEVVEKVKKVFEKGGETQETKEE